MAHINGHEVLFSTELLPIPPCDIADNSVYLYRLCSNRTSTEKIKYFNNNGDSFGVAMTVDTFGTGGVTYAVFFNPETGEKLICYCNGYLYYEGLYEYDFTLEEPLDVTTVEDFTAKYTYCGQYVDKYNYKWRAADKVFTHEINETFEEGKEAERREKWNKHINGLNSGWLYGFAGGAWNDETFTPYTDIVTGASNIIGLFTYSDVTDLKVIMEKYGGSFDLTRSANASNLFNNSKVTRVPKLILSSCTTFTAAFQNCTELVSIDELSIPKVTNTSNAFAKCTSLKEIRISGEIKVSIDLHWSPLSQESVESIVAALSDTATGQTITLNNAQMEAIYGGGGWNELKATKPNWTFALADA